MPNPKSLRERKVELVERLTAVKKGPAWNRRVDLVHELLNDMLDRIDDLNSEIDDIRYHQDMMS